MKKRWQLKAKGYKLKANEDIIKILLENRGLKTKKEIEEFFDTSEPSSQKIIKQLKINKKGLTKAVKRIKNAIKEKESIIIYGDYDADGVCATAVLWETLYGLGAKVLPFIPLREEHGYGLSKKGIDEILTMKQLNNPPTGEAGETIKLIITVDNGIVAHKAVDYAKSKGIDVIITDHHQPQKKLPKVEAIVWTDKLAGVGVSWILAQELAKDKEGLDLVTIGTIADLVPLLGANRSMVKTGLEKLNETQRVGLKALLESAGLQKGQIFTWQIGYIIAPRLNAMGRLETGLDSLRLLCTKNHQKAEQLAQLLGQTNKDRQELTLSTFEHAKSGVGLEQKKILFIAHESYNQGVIGLVAGKLVEEFYRPAVVVSKGKIYSKGSVRSITGFNIIECLRKLESYYEDIGGHPMAAGFTVKTEKLEIFQQKLEELANQQVGDELLQPVLKADCEIKLEDINHDLFAEIKKFEPFGMGNPQPTFVSCGVQVVSFRTVGKEAKHLKLSIRQSSNSIFNTIAFNHGQLAAKLEPGQKIDILYTIEEDSWNGNHKLQLKIRDIKLA